MIVGIERNIFSFSLPQHLARPGNAMLWNARRVRNRALLVDDAFREQIITVHTGRDACRQRV